MHVRSTRGMLMHVRSTGARTGACLWASAPAVLPVPIVCQLGSLSMHGGMHGAVYIHERSPTLSMHHAWGLAQEEW